MNNVWYYIKKSWWIILTVIVLVIGILFIRWRGGSGYIKLYFTLSDKIRDSEVQRVAESEDSYKEYKKNIEEVKVKHQDVILKMTKEEELKYDELYASPDKLDAFLIGIAKGK